MPAAHRLTAKECQTDRTCETCRRAFRPKRQTAGRFCSTTCQGIGHRVPRRCVQGCGTPVLHLGYTCQACRDRLAAALIRAAAKVPPPPVTINGIVFDVVPVQSGYQGGSTAALLALSGGKP